MSIAAVAARCRFAPRLLTAALWLLPLEALLLAGPAFAADPPGAVRAQAQLLIDSGRPEDALRLLDGLLRRAPNDARALFLRSTARLVSGDVAGGRSDLERALALDPKNRQAWLTRAGLDIAETSHAAALAALGQAEALDPAALDNHLNIGAVLLLQGKLSEATDRFRRYLAAQPATAEPYFLVAKNYAAAGFAGLAVEHLRRAVGLDERSRLRARNDPSFAGLAANAGFQELLATDSYRPPPGAWTAARTYDAPYDGGSGKLLGAVLDALLTSGERFDPRVEVTPGWALVWGELRIKVSGPAGGGGTVEVSAPAERFTAPQWRERSERLFRAVTIQLIGRSRPEPGRSPPATGRRPVAGRAERR
jgi:tetratricopeptide (TPR) repeat protein